MADIKTIEDLTEFLTGQHEDLKGLLPKVLEASGDERRDLFTKVRRTLAVHEALEQQTVHPAAEQLPGDDPSQRLKEEEEAESAFTELESLDVDSDDFAKGFGDLQGDIVDHAEHEEHDEFDKLSGELTDKAQGYVDTALGLFEQVEDGSLPGETFADMLDGAKEAIRGSE